MIVRMFTPFWKHYWHNTLKPMSFKLMIKYIKHEKNNIVNPWNIRRTIIQKRTIRMRTTTRINWKHKSFTTWRIRRTIIQRRTIKIRTTIRIIQLTNSLQITQRFTTNHTTNVHTCSHNFVIPSTTLQILS